MESDGKRWEGWEGIERDGKDGKGWEEILGLASNLTPSLFC